MENATKRIRKSRRQGLQRVQSKAMGTTRANTRTPTGPRDIEDAPRPNRQRKTRTTVRKARRQSKVPAGGKR